MDRKKVRSILFFILGAALFWYVYRDLETERLREHLGTLRWEWIGVSIALNLFSHLIKALRWKMLITPLNYSPGMTNLFLSNLVLAVTNLIIPRGGEFARLGVVSRFEKIPFSKLLGTGLAERLTDLVVLVLIGLTLVVWQFDNFMRILGNPQISPGSLNVKRLLIRVIIIAVAAIIIYILFFRLEWGKKLRKRLRKFWKELGEGFGTIARIKGVPLYIFYSLFQYVLWFFMLYVIFFAFPPTDHLSLSAAAFTFGLSTMAFLLPIQAGIGAWHFVVIQGLLLFGIDEPTGQIFALIAHSFTLMIHLVTGSLALIILPLVNR